MAHSTSLVFLLLQQLHHHFCNKQCCLPSAYSLLSCCYAFASICFLLMPRADGSICDGGKSLNRFAIWSNSSCVTSHSNTERKWWQKIFWFCNNFCMFKRLHSKKILPHIHVELPVNQFSAHCIFSCCWHHWEEHGSCYPTFRYS